MSISDISYAMSKVTLKMPKNKRNFANTYDDLVACLKNNPPHTLHDFGIVDNNKINDNAAMVLICNQQIMKLTENLGTNAEEYNEIVKEWRHFLNHFRAAVK